MKFEAFEDGGSRIIFNEKEIEIIKEKKCLTFTPEFFKHFKNNLMGMVVNFEQVSKNKKYKKLTSYPGSEIKTK